MISCQRMSIFSSSDPSSPRPTTVFRVLKLLVVVHDSLICYPATDATLARDDLLPRLAQHLHIRAGVVGAVAGEVAVRFESNCRVVASKEKFLPITHFWALVCLDGASADRIW